MAGKYGMQAVKHRRQTGSRHACMPRAKEAGGRRQARSVVSVCAVVASPVPPCFDGSGESARDIARRPVARRCAPPRTRAIARKNILSSRRQRHRHGTAARHESACRRKAAASQHRQVSGQSATRTQTRAAVATPRRVTPGTGANRAQQFHAEQPAYACSENNERNSSEGSTARA